MTVCRLPTRPGQVVEAATPVCSLGHDRGRLVVRLAQHGRGREMARIAGAGPELLEDLVGRHRAALSEGWEPGPLDPWVTATDELLAGVYDLISRHLVELLWPLPRVALDLEGDLLPRLPIEAAHRPGTPALFELGQVFRSADPNRPDGGRATRRSFRLELWPCESSDLDGVALEQLLIGAAHHPPVAAERAPDRVQRLIHVAGHEPSIPSAGIDPGERAHVVLSGCDSRPPVLPPGVTSALGTLWPIDDHANATIMGAYHARLAGGIGPLEALRQAQLLHRAMPSTTWASYVHVGDPH